MRKTFFLGFWQTSITLIAISGKPCPISGFSTNVRRSCTNVARTVRQSTAEPLYAALDMGSATKKGNRSWFPRRPEDALFQEYNTLVKGAYVRHVVLETKEMADLAIQMYLKGGNHDDQSSNVEPTKDPFSKLAQDLSACALSREEGGKIGELFFGFVMFFISAKVVLTRTFKKVGSIIPFMNQIEIMSQLMKVSMNLFQPL